MSAHVTENEVLDLSFTADLAIVNVVRKFVSSFYGRVLKDDEWSERLGLVAHELMENAIKCGKGATGRLRIEIDTAPPGGSVAIRTWNRASKSDQEEVTRAVEELSRVDDPYRYYLSLVRRQARMPAHVSGLGLGRIRAEAGMTLHTEVDGDVVCVVAKSSLSNPEVCQ
jgi:hypothetical protein